MIVRLIEKKSGELPAVGSGVAASGWPAILIKNAKLG
jgi:hypothetical protein